MSHSHLPFKAKTVGAAALFALTLSSAQAASLGKLTVLSSLGQPLRAEIELVSVDKDESEGLVAKLAPVAAFEKTNIDYNPVLASLRFEVVKHRDRQLIRITSSRPMNDPFIAMLLELRSDSGRLMREYTFLLDPPELRASAPAQVVSPIAVAAPESSNQPSYAPTQSVQPVEVVKWVEPTQDNRSYVSKKKRQAKVKHRVKRGQSLRYIARNSHLKRVSQEQALVALYCANPHAFMQDNMNLLQVGKTLHIPDVETAQSINREEAHTTIAEHEREFAHARQRLADQASKAAPAQKSKSGQSAAGRVLAPSLMMENSSGATKDRLKVSRAPMRGGNGAAGDVGTSGKQGATDPALDEANARIKALEKSLSELKALLQVRSQSLATQQKQALLMTGEASEKSETAVAAVTENRPEVTPDEQVKAGDGEKLGQPDQAAKPTAALASVADQKSAAKPETKPVAKQTKPSKSSSMIPAFLQDLMQNRLVLALVGVLFLLLIMLRMRKGRQKKAEKILDFDSMMDEPKLDSSDGAEASLTNNNFFTAPVAVASEGLLDAEEVDALAEAEVYLAYGRENQAIDVLKAGLRSNGERNDYRVKLLDIYAQKGDVYSFNTLASELHVMTEGKGEEWAHAAALGATIAPGNPLFAQAEAVDEEIVAEDAGEPAMVTETPSSEAEEVEADVGEEMLSASEETVQEAPPVAVPIADMARMNPEDVEEFAGDTPQENETPETPMAFESSSDEDAVSGLAVDEPEVEATASKDAAPLNFDLDDVSETPAAQIEVLEEEEAISDEALDSLTEFTLAETVTQYAPSTATGTEAQPVESGQIEQQEEPSTSELEAPAIAVGAAAASFDFSSINLDLDTPPTEIPPVPELTSGASSGRLEVDTKLELADAYMGIGDKEGARELLEEVLQEGSEAQIARAREAISKLS